MKMENFLGTKSWRKILEGLKQNVDIFIGTKNIFNPVFFFNSFFFFDLIIPHTNLYYFYSKNF